MREHASELMGLAEAFADGPNEAEDILQETWIIAYEKGAKVAPEDVRAWLFKVTLNRGRDLARKRKRRAALAFKAPTTDYAAPCPPVTIQGELDRRALWRAIANLPTQQRKTVLLRLVADKSVADTSASLGIATGTVKKTLHTAIQRLRAEVSEHALRA